MTTVIQLTNYKATSGVVVPSCMLVLNAPFLSSVCCTGRTFCYCRKYAVYKDQSSKTPIDSGTLEFNDAACEKYLADKAEELLAIQLKEKFNYPPDPEPQSVIEAHSQYPKMTDAEYADKMKALDSLQLVFSRNPLIKPTDVAQILDSIFTATKQIGQ